MELEAKGWEEWYGTVFGWDFVDALAPHHVDALEWHWNARMALRKGETPEYLSYFPIWAREAMKSTVARRLTVCDAALSTSDVLEPRKRAGYCLYVSRNRDMASKHALSIETLLGSRGVRRYYPKLSQVRKNNMGGSKGWRATFFYTEAGYVYQFSGVDEGVAGGNVDDTRPTLLVPDDIDSRTDSPVVTQNRFTTFTTEILPMAQKGTLVFFAQNLITRYSVMYKIHKGHVRVLTNRRPTQPIKAINNLVTITDTVNGIVKDVVVSGTPTWHLFGLDRAQECIDREGLPAFLKERQHEVEQDRSGLVLQNWDDRVHVISKSEFANKFGTREMPQAWYKDIANDWARTNTQFHANVAGILATSAQNSAHPGLTFLFHPMSFAANTAPEDVALRILTAVAPRVLANGKMVKWDQLMKDTLQRSGMDQYDFSLSELIDQRRKVLATVFPKYVRPVLRAQKVRRLRGSHEQSKTGALEVYQRVFGMDFVATNPGGSGGVDMLNLMQTVDYSQDHLFRAGEKGMSNYYVVVEDDPNSTSAIPGPPPFEESMSPDELFDGARLRYQFANCRYRDPHLTVAGEVEGEILKLHDDFLSIHMFWLHDQTGQNMPLTGEEKAEAMLAVAAPDMTLEAIFSDPTRWRHGALAAREHALAKMKRNTAKPIFSSALAQAEWERNHQKKD